MVRWTAPIVGAYDVVGEFGGVSTGFRDVDVYVDGTNILAETLAGLGVTTPSQTRLVLSAGSVVDFTVGTGGNGVGFDHTKLDVMISEIAAIPLPATLSLLIAGLGKIAVMIRRRG